MAKNVLKRAKPALMPSVIGTYYAIASIYLSFLTEKRQIPVRPAAVICCEECKPCGCRKGSLISTTPNVLIFRGTRRVRVSVSAEPRRGLGP